MKRYTTTSVDQINGKPCKLILMDHNGNAAQVNLEEVTEYTGDEPAREEPAREEPAGGLRIARMMASMPDAMTRVEICALFHAILDSYDVPDGQRMQILLRVMEANGAAVLQGDEVSAYMDASDETKH